MSIFENVKNPPKEFSPAAFWFWYGALNPDELRRQIDLMVEQGVYNGFMHSRAYLKTQYLEDEWWDAVSACVDEGNKTGFYPWLYDEYAWPSGTAGNTFNYGYQKPSRTLAAGEKNMAKSLRLRRFASASEYRENTANEKKAPLCVFSYDGENYRLVDDVDSASGEILAYYVKVHPTLVDYMNKDTIREFMDYTHEEYKKRYGEYFGNRIPGIFFDEIYMNHFVPWTDKLPEEFMARRGYDIMPMLYVFAGECSDSEKNVRRDFYKTLAELYEEAFFDQIGSWCEENNLLLTGHTEEELLIHPSRQGNYFNTVRHLQVPGADCHDYRYRFPRKITYREPKLAVSVSRIYGRERAMSEAFGGAGWACTLQEFKRGVNTAGAMGISMFTLHGFYSDIDSQGSQSDWPGNFFYQNPYWRYFRHFADYISRVCYMNSCGKPVVDVALYYPIEEMQRETDIKDITPAGRLLNDAFNNALNSLVENQIDTDMVDCENLLKAEISDGRLCVGDERFAVLLIPDVAILDEALLKKLESFCAAGGKVIYYKSQNEKESGAIDPIYAHEAVSEAIRPDVRVLNGNKTDLFANHRKIEGKDFYFVSNSTPEARTLTLLLREKGNAVKISPETGESSAVDFTVTDDGTVIKLVLSEDEGVWIVIDPEDVSLKYKSERVAEEMIVVGRWEFLPIPDDICGEEQIKLDRARIQIPLATFSSSLHGVGRQIRIQNKEGEQGYVGRHLSPWNASWITRRMGWKDNCSSGQLYFRRAFSLDEKPENARICLAAINEWRLYINGAFVSSSGEGINPTTLDISEYLQKGENAICVSVHNPTPLAGGTILQRDEPIAQFLTSLIAEIEMTLSDGKQVICTDQEWDTCESVQKEWINIDYSPKIAHFEASARLNQAPSLKPFEWNKAWERGKPPMKPFGDLPLFGESIKYPQRVCYGIELPCGTAKVYYPNVSGSNTEILIDGMPAIFKNDVCAIIPDGNTHYMQIMLSVNSEKEGLHTPISAELVSMRHALCDWRLLGLKWYSGFALYKNCFKVGKMNGRYVLDLNQASHQAEVWINGNKVGERVWAPYKFDITEFLKDGDNEIAVIVSNSAGVWHQFALLDEGEAIGWNRYWNYDNIQRDSEKLVSGLSNLVKITRLI